MNNETITHMTMCLQALANVIKSNPGKFNENLIVIFLYY